MLQISHSFFCCLAQFKASISISKELEMCVTPHPNNNTKEKAMFHSTH